MGTRGDTIEAMVEALDAVGVGALLIRADRVWATNERARALLGPLLTPSLVGLHAADALGRGAGLPPASVARWYHDAARAQLQWRARSGSGWVEAELRAPLVARFPYVDAVLLRGVEGPGESSRIAHDLRNILHSVGLGLSLLGRREGVGLDQSITQDLTDLAARASTLARRLTAKSSPPPAPGEGWSEVERLARALVGERLVWRVANPAPPVAVPAEEWESVLLNLLFNARDATASDAPIEVSARRLGAEVEVRVQDRGAGMSGATLRRALEPGFTTKDEGTGHGLALVRSIVTAHGGSVELWSAPGVGTTVRVRVPAG